MPSIDALTAHNRSFTLKGGMPVRKPFSYSHGRMHDSTEGGLQ